MDILECLRQAGGEPLLSTKVAMLLARPTSIAQRGRVRRVASARPSGRVLRLAWRSDRLRSAAVLYVSVDGIERDEFYGREGEFIIWVVQSFGRQRAVVADEAIFSTAATRS
jgi:hypothetical protein